MKEKQLNEISLRTDELDKCVNCGLCLSVCPTYLVKGNEGLTARGKIVLLKALIDESIEVSPGIADLFDDCLTCYACQTVCPAGVKTQRLWTTARQDMSGLTSAGKLKHAGLYWTINKPKLFELEVKLAGLLSGFDKDDHRQAKLGKQSLPIFKGAPYIRHLDGEYPVVNEVGSVGLLLGCSVNLSTPWVADAVIKLLNAAGWRVVIPKEQVCCGAPAINNASWDIARKLAVHNIELFNKLNVDKVISPDGTCSSAFSHDYLELFQSDRELQSEAEKLAEITTDLGHLLAEALDDGRLKLGKYKKAITLHDSCHIIHVGRGSRWRDLLNAVDGLEIRELPYSDHCCGFGGSYAFFHNDTSYKIAERKINQAIETGAEEILVGSPGCALRLQSVVNNTNSGIIVRHTAELLAEIVVN
ncbi:(Fe-S)-binding protein [bacterium]|nr:(Fe-S)-binding protein [bacterium]